MAEREQEALVDQLDELIAAQCGALVPGLDGKRGEWACRSARRARLPIRSSRRFEARVDTERTAERRQAQFLHGHGRRIIEGLFLEARQRELSAWWNAVGRDIK